MNLFYFLKRQIFQAIFAFLYKINPFYEKLNAYSLSYFYVFAWVVKIQFDPLPYELDVPIWITVIGSLATGFVIGSLCKWLIDYRYRSELRQGRKLIRGLEKEISSLRQTAEGHSGEPKRVPKAQLEQKSFSSFRDKV